MGAGRGSIIAWPGVGARRGAPWRPGQVDPASCAEGLGAGCRLKDWAAKEGVALSFEGGVRKSRCRPRLRREGGREAEHLSAFKGLESWSPITQIYTLESDCNWVSN